MAWDKEKDLELKYKYIDDNAHNEPNKKSKKTVKKAKHKHTYKPIVIECYDKKDGWFTRCCSYCPICGKINTNDMGSATKELKEKFPKAIFWIQLSPYYDDFVAYCRDNYKKIVFPEFDFYRTKYLPQEYLD